MSQTSFDFAPKPNEEAKEIQLWVERHNQQVMAAARSSSLPPGSLLSALDGTEAKANAVYLLRGVLGNNLRKSMGSGQLSPKSGFLQALRGEIAVKKSTQDPALTIRNILIKAHTP
jgi:hypothetical protein